MNNYLNITQNLTKYLMTLTIKPPIDSRTKYNCSKNIRWIHTTYRINNLKLRRKMMAIGMQRDIKIMRIIISETMETMLIRALTSRILTTFHIQATKAIIIKWAFKCSRCQREIIPKSIDNLTTFIYQINKAKML